MINIITERVIKPPRVVLYAPEGVGKTTFGTSTEKPLFICTERGTDNFEIPRVNAKTWEEVRYVLTYLLTEKHEFKTLVIDTLDWMEALLIQNICDKEKKKSIEDFGFGKGFVKLEEETRKLTKGLDMIIDKGIAVYLLAHAKIEKFNDPELHEPLDRWQMKCHKKTTQIYKEWADAVIFANHDRQVVEGKAVGGYSRRVWATHSAARDAKNRYGIPDNIELDFNTLNKYFQGEN